MTTKTRLEGAADLLRQGRFAEARSKLLKELRLAPKNPVALQLLGAVTFEMGRHDEAIEHLRRAVRLAPAIPGPWINLGKALSESGHTSEAIATLKEAVRRWPEIAEGRFNYANALMARYERRQAVEEYRAAISLAPDLVGPYRNLAIVLSALQEHEAACNVCERLLRLNPDSEVGRLVLASNRQAQCAWDGYDDRLASVAGLVQQGLGAPGLAFASMLFWDDAHLHHRAAVLESAFYAKKVVALPELAVRKSGRIRVAYVSADFRRHPMSRCIPGMIESHDRDRFETVAISLGSDDGSAERQRMTRAFDRFLDMRGSPSETIVRTMRDMQIDIAVDLMGHTSGSHPELFFQRVAPLQVSYLGFPGTSGIAAMDYVIVDPFVARGRVREAATETLVILPDCYFCNDRLAQLSEPPSRAACGLPEGAFVFCSFNAVRKLTPQTFDLWMGILRQVEGSVLWLLKPPDQAEANLRREAAARGVDPARIVFAGRVSNDAHIARNAVPDLHLDTFPCNAHTTASDALRAGAPILTRAGASFVARVCGSLLTTIGVPELIVHSPEEYEALAVRLAGDKALLSGFRRRIEQGRATSPLFDPARFCRNMELAYTAMVERSRAGQPPAEIDVRTLAGAPALG